MTTTRAKVSLLVIILTLMTCKPTLAATLIDLDPGVTPDQTIRTNVNFDGSFFDLSYYIRSTGATAGIRYRTSAVTVTIGGHTATIDISSLVGRAPKSQSIYSLISISRLDIISSIGTEHTDEINRLLQNPLENVVIGANIQIYNAGTGAVLATIRNRDDVASIAGNIGFGQKDINDMKTRWQQASYNTPPPPIAPVLPTGGLRPSILVP